MANSKDIKVTPAQYALLTTILYSDIFSFPVTKNELWKFLITHKKLRRQEFEKGLLGLKKYVVSKNGYYCIQNREEIISHRIKNFSEVTKKLQRAHFVSKKLATISSILFIGITGGLAVGNAKKNDDIDLVIITKENTLFTSRLLVLIMLQLFGMRRTRKQKNTADMICANLLFDESVLVWPKNQQDIYTAREIAQIMPLFEREKTYQRFIKANEWVRKYLPNAEFKKPPNTKTYNKLFERTATILFFNPLVEQISRNLQMSWMKRHQTKETITKHVLAFHPNDYRTKTLQQLRLKMLQLGLLTKF